MLSHQTADMVRMADLSVGTNKLTRLDLATGLNKSWKKTIAYTCYTNSYAQKLQERLLWTPEKKWPWMPRLSLFMPYTYQPPQRCVGKQGSTVVGKIERL